MIYDLVKKTIELTERQYETAPGLIYDFKNIVKKVYYYANSRFTERDDDAIFWNLGVHRSVHFAKNIDLDTKDLTPYAIGEANMFKVWVLKMRFQKWIKDSQMPLILNDLSQNLADFGSAVWKIVDKEGYKMPENCDLGNLYFNVLVDNIRKSNIVEKHYLTLLELEAKKDVWNERVINKIREKLENNKCNIAEIWEYWGWYDDKYINAFGWEDQILYENEEDEKDNPYYDFHIGAFRKRWLRVGVYERLFKLQERANQLVNQNAKTSEIASTLLLRSSDGLTMGNVLEGVLSGEIIQSTDLQQIPLTNQGVVNFINEMALIERQADKLCLTPEVVTGDVLPSGTPFRAVATLSNAAKSAFTFIRQSIGEKVGFVMLDVILPDVVKEWSKDKFLEITDDERDIAMYDDIVKNQVKYDFVNQSNMVGAPVTDQMLAGIDQKVVEDIQKLGRKVKIEKDMFDFDYGIRMNVTGESIDKSQQNDAMFNALQMVQANPAIVETPLFKQYLENNQINYWRLTTQQINQLQQKNQQGQPSQSPMGAKTDALMSLVNTK